MEQQDIKRMAIALVVISALTFIYLWFVGSQVPQQTVQHTDTIQQDYADTLVQNQQHAQPTDPQTQHIDTLTTSEQTFSSPKEPIEESRYRFSNDELIVEFSSKGGRPARILLKKYKTSWGDTVELLTDKASALSIEFDYAGRLIKTMEHNFFFEHKDSLFIFTLPLDSHATYQHIYWFDSKQPYVLHYKARWLNVNPAKIPPSAYINTVWEAFIKRQEKNTDLEKRYTELYYRLYDDEEVDYITGNEPEEEEITLTIEWVAFKQQFFTSALISEDGFTSGRLSIGPAPDQDTIFLKYASANLTVPIDQAQAIEKRFYFYFGPNDYKILKSLGVGLEEVIPLGWTIFRWINKFIIIPAFEFFVSITGNVVIALVLLTLLIKLLLSPLTYKSYVAMAKLNVLKPELEALTKKYKDDPQKLSMEQLKLYQQTGVNPFGGCLPMLLQLPILIAMYNFVISSIDLRQKGFLWIKDFSSYDVIATLPFKIPFYGDHVSLLALLMAISSVLYTKVFSQTPTTQTNPATKWMQYLMPILLLGFFNNMPAALTFYYLLYNILSLSQAWLIKKFFVDEEKIRKEIEQRKRSRKGKKSIFEARLEKMRQMQKEAKKRRKRR